MFSLSQQCIGNTSINYPYHFKPTVWYKRCTFALPCQSGWNPPPPHNTLRLISSFLSFQRECFNQVNGGKLLHRFYSLPSFGLTYPLSIILIGRNVLQLYTACKSNHFVNKMALESRHFTLSQVFIYSNGIHHFTLLQT